MFTIDPMSRTPIYEQLTTQTEKLLMLGVIETGYQMPSVRSLSCTLSINPNTVQKAYNDLCQRGILVSVPGKGCFVAAQAVALLKAQSRARLTAFEELVRELKLAGIEKGDLVAVVDSLYSERSEEHAASDTSGETL